MALPSSPNLLYTDKFTRLLIFCTLGFALFISTIVLLAAFANSFTDTSVLKLDAGEVGGNNDRNADPNEQGPEFALVITDPDAQQPLSASAVLSGIYPSSAFLLPISWGAVGGTLLWRGRIKSVWSKQGYDYDSFRLVARMRGSQMRVRLLNSLAEAPKNKLQLARELGVDWKTVHNHIELLSKSSFVREAESIGTAKYYAITEQGRNVLSLLVAEKNKN